MFQYDETVDRLYGIELVNDMTIRKTAQFSHRPYFDWIQKLVNHLIVNPDPMVVPVYRFEVLEDLPNAERSWGSFKYAYEMMRLPKLTNDEKDALNDIISNRWKDQETHPAVVKARKEFPELYTFMTKVMDDGYYTDIHDGNFLKDQEGNYRIIDLEGFSSYPSLGIRAR